MQSVFREWLEKGCYHKIRMNKKSQTDFLKSVLSLKDIAEN